MVDISKNKLIQINLMNDNNIINYKRVNNYVVYFIYIYCIIQLSVNV